MVDHLPGGLLRGGAMYAVFSFYLLSGYLMTLVLNETYGFSTSGVRRFLANRALRIYPPYFAALVLAALAYLIRYLVRGWPAPPLAHVHAVDFVGQVLLLHLPGVSAARWIPPSWSLDVEVAYYVALVFLARRRGVAFAWLGLSLAYLAKQLWDGDNFILRYFTFAAASLPFSLGSVLYHVRGRVPRSSWLWSGVAFAAFAVNIVGALDRWISPLISFYLSLALTVVVAAMLRDIDVLAPVPRLRRADAWLGNLAYPLFLCHHAIMLMMVALLPASMPLHTFAVDASVVTLSLLAAWGMHRGLEVPIAALRNRLRPAPLPAEPAAAPAAAVVEVLPAAGASPSVERRSRR
jgi:peptidoglycan/LPS O-acetylase OafA/YrhL